MFEISNQSTTWETVGCNRVLSRSQCACSSIPDRERAATILNIGSGIIGENQNQFQTKFRNSSMQQNSQCKTKPDTSGEIYDMPCNRRNTVHVVSRRRRRGRGGDRTGGYRLDRCQRMMASNMETRDSWEKESIATVLKCLRKRGVTGLRPPPVLVQTHSKVSEHCSLVC